MAADVGVVAVTVSEVHRQTKFAPDDRVICLGRSVTAPLPAPDGMASTRNHAARERIRASAS
jgi:hypothetical protein